MILGVQNIDREINLRIRSTTRPQINNSRIPHNPNPSNHSHWINPIPTIKSQRLNEIWCFCPQCPSLAQHIDGWTALHNYNPENPPESSPFHTNNSDSKWSVDHFFQNKSRGYKSNTESHTSTGKSRRNKLWSMKETFFSQNRTQTLIQKPNRRKHQNHVGISEHLDFSQYRMLLVCSACECCNITTQSWSQSACVSKPIIKMAN